MILIGKPANCLLGAYVIARSAVLKAVDEFVRTREITRSVKVADTSHDLLTLNFDLLTFNQCRTLRVT